MWSRCLGCVVLVMSMLTAGIGPAAAAAPLEVTLVSLTSPARGGDRVSLTIKTAPGAECAVTIRGRGGQGSLAARTAGDDGTVTWAWRVDNAPGTGRSMSSASWEVARAP